MKTEKELDERIDKRIAGEVMGWTFPEVKLDRSDIPPCPIDDFDYFKPPQEVEEWRSKYHYREPNGSCWHKIPKYSTNTVHMWKMEERIGELGLKEKYCEALAEILENDEDSICPADMFEFIHADPHDKCLAALKAVEEKE